ncbi:hypothetical protein BDA99DRAFT_505254 [Phascolomyces articulosus]|uniref:RNA polymerase II-associated protein 1 C-terminal domain-containing protein n=1 Tax=Phascolomyces articulosus TaxID=60185 RepID=A0AAD5K3W5_9FUNG|nr:hypothetical protein BDA99DRAFT_505254 [Phascolomyces articulosus]
MEEDQDALASMPTLEQVDDDPSDMPALEGVVDPHANEQPHVPVSKKMLDLTSLLGNILSDVTENQVDQVEPPSLKTGTERSKQHVEGFPKPARRSLFKMRMDAKNNTTVSLEQPPKTTQASSSSKQQPQPKNDYEQENLDRIDHMTEEEIEAARKEIMESLSSDSIAILMNRGKKQQEEQEEDAPVGEGEDDDLMVMKERYFADVPTEYEKLAWMDSRFDTTDPPTPASAKEEPVDEKDQMYRHTRFDFQGKPIDPTTDVPVHQGLHHHGEEPDKAGYTLAELFYLVRSQVAPQRVMVLNTLTRILRNAKHHRGEPFWDQVLTLFLRPEIAAVLYLRSAMDDRHLVVLVSAVQAMAALVLEKEDEVKDEEKTLNMAHFNAFLGYVARPKVMVQQDTQEMAGLGEKFTTTLNRLQGKKDEEEEEELEDDAHLAQRDLTQGLLRMNILQRIRYLMLPNSELDAKSMALLVKILIRFAQSGQQVCESIMDHDLLDHVLEWGILKREWPMATQDERMETYPSLATIQLLTVLAQGSRRVAEAINQKAACLLQYLVTPTQVVAHDPVLEKRAYALQIETIKLLRVLVAYGLVMPALQDLHEPMMSWLRAGLLTNNKKSISTTLDDIRAATTMSLLELSLHAAADPHKTTPPHAIDWHQPTAFIPVILAILRTRDRSTMVFDTAVGYFAILASYMDRFPPVDDTISTADIWKVAMEKFSTTSTLENEKDSWIQSNRVLRQVQFLCAFASTKTFVCNASEQLASSSITRLIQQVYDQGSLGRLAMGSWILHVKDRTIRSQLWGQMGYDAAELEMTVTSMHVGPFERQLARHLVQLCILDRLSNTLASTLSLFYLQDSSKDGYPLLLDHNGPRLHTLVYPDYYYQHSQQQGSVTAYLFSPVDEMYHMDKSRLAQKCRESSANVIAATLEAATLLLQNMPMDHDIVLVSLMKVFMISEALVGDDGELQEEKEIFWGDRITELVHQWLDRLFALQSQQQSSRVTTTGSLTSAWRRSASSVPIRQPFYQFYQAFVAQYASVSFGHVEFARLLTYLLIHVNDDQEKEEGGAVDYKYLVWSDYRDILSTLKTPSDVLPYPSRRLVMPVGASLLRAYMSALAENKVEGALREFVMNELKASLDEPSVSNPLKRDISDLLSSCS